MREVYAVDHGEVLRLLAKRNLDIGSHRTRVVCRFHAALAGLAPGGMSKELNASDAEAFLDQVEPVSPVEHVQLELAREMLADVRRLDAQLKDSHRRIRAAVLASKTSLTDLFGVGPMIACSLIGYTPATSAGSATVTSSPPTSALHPSRCPPAAASRTD